MHNPPRYFSKKFIQNSACFEYRVDIPARMIKKLGLAEVAMGGEWECKGEEDLQRYLTALHAQDVVRYYASGGEYMEGLARHFKNFKAVKDPDTGKWDFGPIYIGDVDDNADYVNPINHRFGKLGTRLPNGRLLRPGEPVNMVLPTGEKVEVWCDGKNGVSWEKNLQGIKGLNKSFKLADGVSFTTERLRSYYAQRYNLGNTYVYPNSVDFSSYPTIPLRKDISRIKLFWQGGDSHFADFYPMKEALERAIQDFPELDLVIWGPTYPWVYENIPSNRIISIPWADYAVYKYKLASLDIDIAMAPLVNNKFNIYKSCIKFYEVSALAEPVPMLAADEPPYRDEIIAGETGVLFKMPDEKDPTGIDFRKKLELLIRDARMRKEIAENAKAWVRAERDAEKTIIPYWEWLMETKKEQEARKLYAAEKRLAKRRSA